METLIYHEFPFSDQAAIAPSSSLIYSLRLGLFWVEVVVNALVTAKCLPAKQQ